MKAPTLHALGTPIGTEVRGIDLSDELDGATVDWIGKALTEHPVLVFRDQHLDAAEIASFGRRFGKPEPHRLLQYRHPDFPEVSYITNVDAKGNIDKFGVTRAQAWHTDQSYDENLPWFTLLHALEVPRARGGTMYADMRAAYDELPAAMKERLAGLTAMHGPNTGPRGPFFAPVLGEWETEDHERRNKIIGLHPAVMTHPVSKRPMLYVNPCHTCGFVGMERKEALDLIRELGDHCTQERFVYYHNYRVGDVIIWDDYATLHRGAGDSAPNERRIFLRTIVHPLHS